MSPITIYCAINTRLHDIPVRSVVLLDLANGKRRLLSGEVLFCIYYRRPSYDVKVHGLGFLC